MRDSKIFLDKRSKTTYIRRRSWNKDLRKMEQETIHKYPSYNTPPKELPSGVILTESEQKQYDLIVENEVKEREETSKSVTLSLLESRINDAILATKSIEDMEKLGIEKLDELAEMTNTLKKQINKHKNTLKKRRS